MNELLAAVVLGLVEGITEFLPVSSTGHLIVASRLLGFHDLEGSFEVVIQLGAVLAVLWHYRHELLVRLRSVPDDATARRFFLNLFVAFLPAAIAGLLWGHTITRTLFSPLTVACALIAGGVVLWLVEIRVESRPVGTTSLDEVSLRQALLIGVAQVTALIPGVSRSGASIVGGLLIGLDRQTATTFSFYLALPTLGAATLYKLATSAAEIASAGLSLALIVGTGVAFLTARVAIGWLLRHVSRHDFRGFAVYRVLAGAAVLIWLWCS